MEQEQINQQKTGETPQEKVVKKDESWVSTPNQQEIIEALSTIDVRTVIQERYKDNPENGISLEDFEKNYGSNIINLLQDAVNTNNTQILFDVTRQITENFKDKDPDFKKMVNHHINNISTTLSIDLRNKQHKKK